MALLSQQNFFQILQLQDMKNPYIPSEVAKDFLSSATIKDLLFPAAVKDLFSSVIQHISLHAYTLHPYIINIDKTHLLHHTFHAT